MVMFCICMFILSYYIRLVLKLIHYDKLAICSHSVSRIFSNNKFYIFISNFLCK